MSGKSPRGHSKLRAAAGVFATRQDPSWLYLEFVKRTPVEKKSLICAVGISSHTIDAVFVSYVCQMAAVHFSCMALTPIQKFDEGSCMVNYFIICLLFTYTDILYIYIQFFINNANLLSPSRSGQQGELRTSSKPSTPKATGKVVAWHELKLLTKKI